MTIKQRQKSVEIAKDVLAQIKILNVITGTYLEVENYSVLQENESLQKALDKILVKGNCTVCALGACFLSHVKLYNKVKVDHDMMAFGFMESNVLFDRLKSSLGIKNVVLIETAFEGSDTTGNHAEFSSMEETDPRLDKKVPLAQRFAATEYFYKYNDGPNRLKVIMKNVIANDGEFIPKVSKSI